MRQYLDDYFAEAKVTQRREKGLAALEKHFAGTELYNDLQRAFEGSYALMQTEYYAMRLRLEASADVDLSEYPAEVRDVVLSPEDLARNPDGEGGMIDHSRELVYDEEYEERKAEITGQVDKCLKGLEDHLQQRQARQSRQLRTLVFVEQVLIVHVVAAVAPQRETTARGRRIVRVPLLRRDL